MNAECIWVECKIYANAIYLSEHKNAFWPFCSLLNFNTTNWIPFDGNHFSIPIQPEKIKCERQKKNESCSGILHMALSFCETVSLAFGPVGIIVSTRNSMIYSCNVLLRLVLHAAAAASPSLRPWIRFDYSFLCFGHTEFRMISRYLHLNPILDARLGPSSQPTHILADFFLFSSLLLLRFCR